MWNLFFWPHFCRKYAFRGFWTWVWALKAQWFNFLTTTQFTLMINSIHFHGQFVNVFVRILIDQKKHLDIYFVEIHGRIMCSYSIRVFDFMDLGDIWPNNPLKQRPSHCHSKTIVLYTVNIGFNYTWHSLGHFKRGRYWGLHYYYFWLFSCWQMSLC